MLCRWRGVWRIFVIHQQFNSRQNHLTVLPQEMRQNFSLSSLILVDPLEPAK